MLTIDASTARFLIDGFGQYSPIGRKAAAVFNWLESEPAAVAVNYDDALDFIPDEIEAGRLERFMAYYPEHLRRLELAAKVEAQRQADIEADSFAKVGAKLEDSLASDPLDLYARNDNR